MGFPRFDCIDTVIVSFCVCSVQYSLWTSGPILVIIMNRQGTGCKKENKMTKQEEKEEVI